MYLFQSKTAERPHETAVRAKSIANLAELTDLNVTELSTKAIGTEADMVYEFLIIYFFTEFFVIIERVETSASSC